jgi:ribose transport system substrate-binding protein
MRDLHRRTVALAACRKSLVARNARIGSIAATALLVAMAGKGYAAGETIGYSAPFLMAQFEVVLQDQSVANAKAAGLTILAPTNADQDSGKQITDVRNLIGAGAKGLIVVANDSKAIIPALDFAVAQKVPVVSIDIGPDGAWAISPAPTWPRPSATRARCSRCKAPSARSTAASGAKAFTIA